MKKNNINLLGGICMFAMACTCTATDSIVINADEQTIPVSPKFYGIFFEEINMAGHGGLYAELVRNRNFEDSNKPDHWTAYSLGGASANISISNDVPTGGFNKQSLLLDVNLPTGATGVGAAVNNGYFGISVEKGHNYHLSAFIKGNSDKDLNIWLENEDGEKLAESIINVTTDWSQQTANLKVKKTSHRASLCLGLSNSGAVYMDSVSLFPEKTWKDRDNGMRIDLAEKLQALKPSFIRFPGGCWVEGETMATSYRWKETIGPLSERRTQHCLWGYEVDHGMGYHEYLQLCEDLGAEALFVINCGMSHREVVPMEKMGEYVQDALDAIEYANGPVSTKWGAERAKNGHPEPFHLTMLQVGNENGGSAYDERYALFYDAIKGKYPEIKLVACLWNGMPKSRSIEILDEHYYSTPEFFYNRFHQYDTYKRGEKEIYVGEYAVTQKNGQGALRGALGEAVFMMGMENNSDVVTMTSYAPLFINVNKRSWNPDLINFDNHRVFGTPSYYVQQIFSQHLGKFVVPVKSDIQPIEKNIMSGGGIGVGTWMTQAEYKDLMVYVDGKPVYKNSGEIISHLNYDSNEHKRNWDANVDASGEGTLKQNSNAENVFTYLPNDFTNYTFSVKARKISGNEGFLILFNAKDKNDYAWWNLGGWGNTQHGIELISGGSKRFLSDRTNGKIETNKWYDIRVEVSTEKVLCFLDNKLVHEVSMLEKSYPVYCSSTRTKDTLFVKVVNLSDAARDIDFQINTKSRIGSTAEFLSMSHPDPWAENSLREPQRVAPICKKIKTSSRLQCKLLENSVNVFTFNLKD
jgi:alpha-L-arabinofuranosidase